jgi:hypothetical protein
MVTSLHDRAAVEEDRREVETAHRHEHARQTLVATGEAQQGVVAVTVHHELNRVGNDLARDQRRLHALVAHADAVGDRDRGKPARRAIRGGHAFGHRFRLTIERRVARRRFVPRRGHAHPRLIDFLVAQSHRAEKRALRRTLWAIGDD